MKKLITVALVLLLGLLFPHHVSGRSTPIGSEQKPNLIIPQSITIQPQTNTNESEPCGGQITATIYASNAFSALQTLNAALNSYDDPSNVVDDRYELCFEFPEGPLQFNAPIIFPVHSPGDQSKGVFISGLNLVSIQAANTPAVIVNYNWAPVTFDRLVLADFPEGLRAENTQLTLINSSISGNGDGPCVNLVNSNGSVIQDVDIANCIVGIRMENANNTLIGASDAQHYDQDRVMIHNCGIGIHLVSGDGNLWPRNSIYENNSGLNPNFEWKDGIVIDNNANGGILPSAAKEQTESGGVLLCEKNEEGVVVSRKIEFENISAEGVISLYRTTRDNEYQGKDYIGECGIETDGICILNTLPSWLNIPEGECGLRDLEVIAIYTTTRSSSYTAPMKFDWDSSIPAIPTDVPASTMPQAVDDGDISASSEDADILSGGMSGGAAGGGGAGPGMKCGGTLVPHATLNSAALLHSLIWMTMPLLPIIAIRRRRHK